jgi:NTP pyrophosphatase (non-canonical NTP hydrolase)
MNIQELLESRKGLLNPIIKAGVDPSITMDDFVKKYDRKFIGDIQGYGFNKCMILDHLFKEYDLVIKEDINNSYKQEIYADAIKTFGVPSQVDMLIEEMAELTQALLKYRRGRMGAIDNVYEEVVDVEIVLAQLKTIMPPSNLKYWEEIKLARLQERIENHKK